MAFTRQHYSLFGILFCGLIASNASHAMEEDIDLLVGGYMWGQSYSGDFKVSEYDIRPIDVESDLNYGDDQNHSVYLKILHHSKIFPQIKIQNTVIKSDENSIVPLDFTFGGPGYRFNIDADIYSKMRFNHRDVTLYYNIYDSKLHFDLGITARKFDGRVAIFWEEFNVQNAVSFNDMVPLIYAETDFNFPWQGLSFEAEFNGGSYQGNKLQDVTASLHYRHRSNLGASLGYRYAHLDISDFGGIQTDITTTGPFIAISYLFDKRVF